MTETEGPQIDGADSDYSWERTSGHWDQLLIPLSLRGWDRVTVTARKETPLAFFYSRGVWWLRRELKEEVL